MSIQNYHNSVPTSFEVWGLRLQLEKSNQFFSIELLNKIENSVSTPFVSGISRLRWPKLDSPNSRMPL